MVVRRGHYEKQDVVDALERVHNGESYAEVARTSSVLLCTLFKKAKDQQNGILIEEQRRSTKPAIARIRRSTWWSGLPPCSAWAYLLPA